MNCLRTRRSLRGGLPADAGGDGEVMVDMGDVERISARGEERGFRRIQRTGLFARGR